MPPTLPSSLSPHVCILPSPDLSELLEKSGLPALPNILQSFSPLPQVTTRTTSLVSVPHSSFALRFSDLAEVEEACREPEEQRAARTLDWMSVRIAKRCEKWVQDAEERRAAGPGKDDRVRSPWWDELRRCAEGDFVPEKGEGWNHPVSIILAVSTTAPNPLQVVTALHSRAIRLPPWVDPTYLRYTLIVHPKDSPLSDEEANALFNAVKKQYGLHTYLLHLGLPSPPPPPIPVPALMPRLPPPPGPESPYISRQNNGVPPTPQTANAPAIPSNPYVLNTLRLEEKDIQATARFTREFVVMSLIPWMERCVVEWNEAYSSTRRLPSRLFSSTRRLFGASPSPSPSPGPGHLSSSSVSSLPRQGSISLNNGVPSSISQPRRLAEFATILGDYKLAINIWESLRKESKGGSDIIPMISSPSPAMQLHASNALLSIHPSLEDLPPHAQLRTLLHGARWETAIDQKDFMSDALEGERWLVWAAGNAEEAPSALLLAHAALLSTVKKKAFRRAAFWYASAANRLEKCGIKPLTVYFLRKAQELYQIRPPKELSPSFWDSEGGSPSSGAVFVDIKAGVEHPLARLLYTTGNIADAVRMFLQALRILEYPTLQPRRQLTGPVDFDAEISQDKTFLDDFRVAFAHLSTTEPETLKSLNLSLPLKFCQPKRTKLRFARDTTSENSATWEKREIQWDSFCKSRGRKEPLVSAGKVCAGEYFWIDLAVDNSLDADVDIGNLEVVLETNSSSQDEPIESLVEAEVVTDVTLKARESRTITITVKALQPTSLIVSRVKYDFLSILPVTESLASKGRRLNDTPTQRWNPTYAPDVWLKVDISPANDKLSASFLDSDELLLKQGEIREMKIQLTNNGFNSVGEIWVVLGGEEEVWIGNQEASINSGSMSEIARSLNSLKVPDPVSLPLKEPLEPGASTELSLCLHGERAGSHGLALLFLFRESDSSPFHSARLSRTFEVQQLLDIAISAIPSQSREHSFNLNIEATSVSISTTVSITQISSISPLWKFQAVDAPETSIAPSQTAKFILKADQWMEGQGKKDSLDFLIQKLELVLGGSPITPSEPPEIDLICSHAIHSPSKRKSVHSLGLWDLIQAGRRRYTSENSIQQHPHIPEDSHQHIFPLYHPTTVDVVVFWEMPAQKRKGHVVVYGVRLGATHAHLDEIIFNSENSKVKRSMYAETVREKAELIEGIRASDWNADMDPIVATVEGNEITHDFKEGPCHAPVYIVIRNHSPLYDARVTLKLRPGTQRAPSDVTATFSAAPYSGRLTFRNTLSAGEFVVVQVKLLVDRPGLNSVGPFVLETELLTASPNKRRYTQEVPSPPDVCIVARQS